MKLTVKHAILPVPSMQIVLMSSDAILYKSTFTRQFSFIWELINFNWKLLQTIKLQKLGQKIKGRFILTLGILLSYIGHASWSTNLPDLHYLSHFFQVLSTCNGYYKFSSWTNKKKLNKTAASWHCMVIFYSLFECNIADHLSTRTWNAWTIFMYKKCWIVTSYFFFLQHAKA